MTRKFRLRAPAHVLTHRPNGEDGECPICGQSWLSLSLAHHHHHQAHCLVSSDYDNICFNFIDTACHVVISILIQRGVQEIPLTTLCTLGMVLCSTDVCACGAELCVLVLFHEPRPCDPWSAAAGLMPQTQFLKGTRWERSSTMVSADHACKESLSPFCPRKDNGQCWTK